MRRPARRGGRTLTEEERALWRQVAATTERRVAEPPREDAAPPPSSPQPTTPREDSPATTEQPFLTGRIVRPEGRASTATPAFTPMPPRPASGLDRATETRLRKGRKDPDAVFDLHGMTAARAHSALIRYVSQSRAAGHRLILVITGKGGPGEHRSFGDPGPGVLRRETPIWLATPPLSGMVVNVSRAHPRHGGDGALYVYLKRIRR